MERIYTTADLLLLHHRDSPQHEKCRFDAEVYNVVNAADILDDEGIDPPSYAVREALHVALDALREAILEDKK